MTYIGNKVWGYNSTNGGGQVVLYFNRNYTLL